MSDKPTDDTIALVGFLLGAGWYPADEIRHGIARLGFEMPSSQWVAARLTRMTKEDAPRFERAERWESYREYRVTPFARTGLSNQYRGFSLLVGLRGLPALVFQPGEGDEGA